MEHETQRFKRPTPDEVHRYALTLGYDLDGEQFCDWYASRGWMVGKCPMKDWRAAVRTWWRRELHYSQAKQQKRPSDYW
jgi:hypothetical protein